MNQVDKASWPQFPWTCIEISWPMNFTCKFSTLLIALVVQIVASFNVPAGEPERLSIRSGQTLAAGESPADGAVMTVYHPARGNGTAVIIFPGGGYGTLVVGPEGRDIAAWLTEHGITGVVVEYRLPHGNPALPLADAQRVTRIVRLHAAAWDCNPTRIGHIGFSAGGHLASTAATRFDNGDPQSIDPIEKQSCRPDFSILVYPVVTMGPGTHAGTRSNLLGPAPDTAAIDYFSSEKQVTAATPPAFLAHAQDDALVAPLNSQLYFDALRANGVAAEYLKLPFGGHGLNGYQGPMWESWKIESLRWMADERFIPAPIKPVSLGLSSFNYYSSGPFANTMLTGGAWLEFGTDWGTEVFFKNTDGSENPQFNGSGYPQYLNPGKRLRLLLWPYQVNNNSAPATWPKRGNMGVGKWVVTWQGDADIRLNGAAFLSSGSSGAATGSLVNGRRIYNMAASNPSGHLTVEAINASMPVTDIKVWLPDPANPQNQSLETSGSIWHPAFLKYLANLDFNHLRFMDWGETNSSPQQDWVDRRLPGFGMQHGVLNRRSPALGVVSYTNASGQPVYFSGNRGTGIAYEHMIALANLTGKDPWICIPHLATDAYVVQLANLLLYGSDGINPYTGPQANPVYPPLSPSRRVWIEHSNEIWSNGDSFAQGNWAQAQATAAGITKPQFNARRQTQIWRIFQERFGGSSRLVRAAGIFTGSNSYTNAFLTELKSYGITLTPSVTPDIIAPTTYFGNGIQDWVYEQANLNRGQTSQWFHTAADFVTNTTTGATRPVSLALSDPYWTSPTLANQQAATFSEWKKRIFSGSTAAGGGPDSTGTGGGFSSSLHDEIFNIIGAHLPIVAYEGGPSLYTDYYDGGDSRDDGVSNFFVALNRQPVFSDVYRIQLNMARAKGLSSHSMFVDTSSWGKYGQWGHLEYPDQPPVDSVKWQAVNDWADEMAGIRLPDDPVGTRPSFVTAGKLPVGRYLMAYSQDIVVTGGDLAGAGHQFNVIGTQMDSGFTLAPVAGDPLRYRVSGTPRSGGWNYFYLRVNDDDGDAAWQIYSFYIAGGPGTLIEADLAGTYSGASALPWTKTHVVDTARVTYSGLNRGAADANGGGTATGSDGTGVKLYPSTDALRFSVSQGSATASSATLASAIADNEYWKFTVTPLPGKPLQLRNAEMRLSWMRNEYHSVRNFVIMTSVGGFTQGQQIYTSGSTPEEDAVAETVFRLPDSTTYDGLVAPVEFRIYFCGSQYGHQASLLGLKLTRDIAFSPPSYAQWSAAKDWQGADSLPLADPNQDGCTNLLAYALDLDPFGAITGEKLPQIGTDTITPGGPWLTFVYRRNAAAADLSYTVRTSTSLSEWQDRVIDYINVIEEIADPDPDGDDSSRLIRVRIKIEAQEVAKFISLKVTLD